MCSRPIARVSRREQGFTLIELMVSMVMALIVLAGLVLMFVSFSDVERGVASRTERMTDLYLASQIMQAELRQSPSTPLANVLDDLAVRGISVPANYPTENSDFISLPHWDTASQTLTYQNLEGSAGIFQYQRTSDDRVYWLRPSGTNFQEFIRDLDTVRGVEVAISGNIVTATLNSSYVNENKEEKTVSLRFKIWARN